MSDSIPSFAVIGGDARLAACAAALRADGNRVILCCHSEENEEVPPGYDNYILPIPVSIDNQTLNTPLIKSSISFKSFFDAVGGDAAVFGGMIGKGFRDAVEQQGCSVFDYAQNDDFQYANAVLTAEGAIALYIASFPGSVYGSDVLITGFGRIAKMLASRLASLGANISVFARKEADRAYAAALGYAPVRYKMLGGKYDAVFNTVPAGIFSREILAGFDKGAIYFELASAPYGASRDDMIESGFGYVSASGLPGRFSPESAGCIIKQTVCSLIRCGGI